MLWLLLAIGCASPMSALRDDNRRLTRSVTELRTERRAQDRKLRDLQHQLDKLRADRVSTMMGALPNLPVEVAGPPEAAPAGGVASRVVAITDDGTEIVYEGEAATGKTITIEDDAPPRRIRAEAPERTEVSRRPAAARTTRMATRDRDPSSPPRGSEAANDYRTAVELVRGGSPGDGITALREFLSRHPRHDYADNAQYWLGEAFYAQRDYPHALSEFRNVIQTYPRGNKVPDALLKVGYCYHALGQSEKARAVLEQVVNLYPKTEPAVLAAKRLETP